MSSDANAYTQRVNVVKIDASGNILDTANLPLEDYTESLKTSTTTILTWDDEVDTWLTMVNIKLRSASTFFEELNDGLEIYININNFASDIPIYRNTSQPVPVKYNTGEGYDYIVSKTINFNNIRIPMGATFTMKIRLGGDNNPAITYELTARLIEL